jgi:hypothetical protein
VVFAVPWRNNPKFLPTKTEKMRIITKTISQSARDLLKEFITYAVSPRVINAFEIINVSP